MSLNESEAEIKRDLIEFLPSVRKLRIYVGVLCKKIVLILIDVDVFGRGGKVRSLVGELEGAGRGEGMVKIL